MNGQFGLCPTCHKTNGYINVGSNHWFRCDEHKMKWCTCANIFSSWREETEEQQRERYYGLGIDTYKMVEPFHPKPTVTTTNQSVTEIDVFELQAEIEKCLAAEDLRPEVKTVLTSAFNMLTALMA
jgi:hypothetical protein